MNFTGRVRSSAGNLYRLFTATTFDHELSRLRVRNYLSLPELRRMVDFLEGLAIFRANADVPFTDGTIHLDTRQIDLMWLGPGTPAAGPAAAYATIRVRLSAWFEDDERVRVLLQAPGQPDASIRAEPERPFRFVSREYSLRDG